MSKIILEIELDYDPMGIHGYTDDGMRWFFLDILLGNKGELLLHSNEIGDTIGEVRVLKMTLDKDAVIPPEGLEN